MAPAGLKQKAARLGMKLDPDGVRQRKEEAARKHRRVEARREESGNAALAGRELAVDEALTAKNSVWAEAAALRSAGLDVPLREARTIVYLDRLRGLDPWDRLAPTYDPPGGGDTGGYGDDRHDGDDTGRFPENGYARAGPDDNQRAQLAELLRQLGVTLAPIAKGECDHRQREDKYRPGRTLSHLVRARTTTCSAPGCTAQAIYSEIDHTVPWPTGGTDQCNLAPLCSRHHHAKHAPGWKLQQLEPGVMQWTLPSGHVHTTTPTKRTRRRPRSWAGSRVHGYRRDAGRDEGMRCYRRYRGWRKINRDPDQGVTRSLAMSTWCRSL